jgi:hypothetical protein
LIPGADWLEQGFNQKDVYAIRVFGAEM